MLSQLFLIVGSSCMAAGYGLQGESPFLCGLWVAIAMFDILALG